MKPMDEAWKILKYEMYDNIGKPCRFCKKIMSGEDVDSMPDTCARCQFDMEMNE